MCRSNCKQQFHAKWEKIRQKFWANWVTAFLKEYDSYISGPIETYCWPYPEHIPFPRRPCWKGYVRVNKTQLKKTLWKITISSSCLPHPPGVANHTWFQPHRTVVWVSLPVILDMPTAMIICQYCSNLCFSLVCPLPHSCCVIWLRLKVDGLGNQSSQMRRHIL